MSTVNICTLTTEKGDSDVGDNVMLVTLSFLVTFQGYHAARVLIFHRDKIKKTVSNIRHQYRCDAKIPRYILEKVYYDQEEFMRALLPKTTG